MSTALLLLHSFVPHGHRAFANNPAINISEYSHLLEDLVLAVNTDMGVGHLDNFENETSLSVVRPAHFICDYNPLPPAKGLIMVVLAQQHPPHTSITSIFNFAATSLLQGFVHTYSGHSPPALV